MINFIAALVDYPLKFVNEFATIAASVAGFVVLYTYRDRVLLALTGDTHLHGNILDLTWWTFRCGGLCSGDSTRWLTNFACCPKDIRNMNIVKACGRVLGFATKNVEIKNLVVGDLPYRGRGDFYLEVRCSTNPSLVTSVAEDRSPKVVHFPEVLTLRMRQSWLESRVKITCMELQLLGATPLCELYLNPVHLLDWRDDEKDRVKRFEMRVVNDSIEVDTSPWILIEFGIPTEPRNLDHLRGTPDFVRTVHRDGHTQDQSILEFKETHALLNRAGVPVEEPDEADIDKIRSLRTNLACVITACNTFVALSILLYLAFRSFLGSCYQQFTMLTMAIMHNVTLPIGNQDLTDLTRRCAEQTLGTGVDPGIPCRPSDEQVVHTCHDLPPIQPWPGALTPLFSEVFGLNVRGIPCKLFLAKVAPASFIPTVGICELREAIVPYDAYIFIGGVMLILSTIFIRMVGNFCIRRHRSRLQQKHAELNKMLKMASKTREQ